MSAPVATPLAPRFASYPALVARAHWTVSAGSVGIAVTPVVGETRLFYALDRLVTGPRSRLWRPVKDGEAFDRAARYRLRRGADTTELVEFVVGAERIAEGRRGRR